MNRAGWHAPLLDVPIVVGAQQREAELGILGDEQPAGETWKRWKTDRGEDPARVHIFDALINCQHPGRISSRPCGSSPYSSLGRPATALSATLGITTSRNCQESLPSGLCTNRGASWAYFLGKWFLEHVRRFDNVIVDADQDHVVFVHNLPLPDPNTSQYYCWADSTVSSPGGLWSNVDWSCYVSARKPAGGRGWQCLLGIGSAVAAGLTTPGAAGLGADRNADGAAARAAELGAPHTAATVDVTDGGRWPRYLSRRARLTS